MLAVIKISHAQFPEEEYSQDQVDDRENHIVYHLLDLLRGIRPCSLDGSCHITGPRCKGCGAEQAGHQENSQEDAKELLALFHINRLSFFCEKKEPRRYSPRLGFYAGGKKEIPRPVFSVIYFGLLRFQRGDVPVIPEAAPDREGVA